MCITPTEQALIYTCLTTIISCNTFTAFGQDYLQTVGLPMGGALSGSLANIYLGELESAVVSTHMQHILLYRRYMDDILILHRGPLALAHALISDLKHTFQLALTEHISTTQIIFLDLLISNSPFYGLHTSLYSKNSILLKFPLPADKRPNRQVTHLIRTQLIRLWRNNTRSSTLSQQIHTIIAQLPQNPLFHHSVSTILMFLNPLKFRQVAGPNPSPSVSTVNNK